MNTNNKLENWLREVTEPMKKPTSKPNQLITFRGKPVKLSRGEEWRIFSILRIRGIDTKPLITFDYFDHAEHLGTVDDGTGIYHRFILWNENKPTLANCVIVKKK